MHNKNKEQLIFANWGPVLKKEFFYFINGVFVDFIENITKPIVRINTMIFASGK